MPALHTVLIHFHQARLQEASLQEEMLRFAIHMSTRILAVHSRGLTHEQEKQFKWELSDLKHLHLAQEALGCLILERKDGKVA